MCHEEITLFQDVQHNFLCDSWHPYACPYPDKHTGALPLYQTMSMPTRCLDMLEKALTHTCQINSQLAIVLWV